MASAWGSSWGPSWGASWGGAAGPVVIIASIPFTVMASLIGLDLKASGAGIEVVQSASIDLDIEAS